MRHDAQDAGTSEDIVPAMEFLMDLDAGRMEEVLTEKIHAVIHALHKAERHGVSKPKGKLTLTVTFLMDRGVVDATPSIKTVIPEPKRPGTLFFTTSRGRLLRSEQGRQVPLFPPEPVERAEVVYERPAPVTMPAAPAPVVATPAAPAQAPVVLAAPVAAPVAVPPVTPAPVTPASVTPASVTPASVTPASVTPSPAPAVPDAALSPSTVEPHVDADRPLRVMA